MFSFLMRNKMWKSAALAVLAWSTVWTLGASAGDADWVELNHWQGNGVRQTQPFWLLGDSWVLKYQPSDGMSVDLYNLNGEKVGPVMESTGGTSGTAFRKGQGAHFLRVAGAGTWNVVSQVFVSPADKWQLSRLTGELKPPLKRLAVWTGRENSRFSSEAICALTQKLFQSFPIVLILHEVGTIPPSTPRSKRGYSQRRKLFLLM